MEKKTESPTIDLDGVQNIVLAMVVIMSLLTGIVLWKSPEQVPLFFSRPYGREQLANHWWLLLFPILSTIIYLFGFYIKKRMKSSPISTSMGIWVNFGSVVLLLLSEIFITTLIF